MGILTPAVDEVLDIRQNEMPKQFMRELAVRSCAFSAA